MSEKPMTPKERRIQLLRDMYNSVVEPYMTKEERLHSMEIWLHMFEDTVTSDLILQTQIDELKTQLSAYKDMVEGAREFFEWLEEYRSDIFYKEPCEWQDKGDYDSRCGGHLETDTNAWICGKEDNCPLHWGAYGLIEGMLEKINKLSKLPEVTDESN